MRELLLCKLEQLRAQMVAGGGVADEDLKSRSQRIYDAYHGLDGNGHGTAINRRHPARAHQTTRIGRIKFGHDDRRGLFHIHQKGRKRE